MSIKSYTDEDDKKMLIEGQNRNYEMSCAPVPIVVIDSGIDRSVADLDRYVMEETGYTLNADGDIVENDLPVRNEHGTMAALIIRYICPQIAITSINILDEQLRSDGRILIQAFDNAVDRNPKIIHMSLGTPRLRYRFALKRLVNKAWERNIAVVAADSNDFKNVYPASLRHVVGVRADLYNQTITYTYKKKYFYGPPGLQNIHGIESLKHKQAFGCSMAAAYITGYLSRILLNHRGMNVSFTEIINELRIDATHLERSV
jgi:hypothetical protein